MSLRQDLFIPLNSVRSQSRYFYILILALLLWPILEQIISIPIGRVVFGLIIAFYFLRRWTSRPAILPPLELKSEYAKIPRKIGGATYDQIRFDEITNFEIRGRGLGEIGLIETNSRLYVLPRQAFLSPLHWQMFVQEIFGRIAELPDGGQRLVALEEKTKLARNILSRRPRVTSWLIGLITAVFVLQTLVAGSDPFDVIRLGANSAPLVKVGQWWRLVTSGFLHVNFIHYLFNVIGLYSLGTLIEIILGWRRLLILFLGSLIAASITSVVNGHILSLGVSGAVFGLLGALATLNARYRELPAGLIMSKRWWIVVIGVNGLLPIMVPNIDISAHIGGFFAGALIAFGLLWRLKLVELRGPESVITRTVNLVLVVCCLFAFLSGVRYAFDNDQVVKSSQIVTAELANDLNQGPEVLNNFAWQIVTSPNSSVEQIRLARSAVNTALQKSEDPTIKDTLATVMFFQGEIEAAIEIEYDLLLHADEPLMSTFAAQLARFLRFRGCRADICRLIKLGVDNGNILITQDDQIIQPLEILAVINVDNRAEKLIRMVTNSEKSSIPMKNLYGSRKNIADHFFTVELLDVRLIERSELDQTKDIRQWSLDDSIFALPLPKRSKYRLPLNKIKARSLV